MKGILLSLGILIPTILPSQIRLVPFPGIFSTYIGAHLSKRQFCLRPLSRELFSISLRDRGPWLLRGGFHPLSRGLFFNYNYRNAEDILAGLKFSSPFPGTFFQSVF